jgi:hypothetical protein
MTGKTKICDTPRARKIDPHPLIVTMLHCPRTNTCRMHPVYSRNWKEVVVNNAHLHTLAPQVEVANSVVWRCILLDSNTIEVRKDRVFFPQSPGKPTEKGGARLIADDKSVLPLVEHSC